MHRRVFLQSLAVTPLLAQQQTRPVESFDDHGPLVIERAVAGKPHAGKVLALIQPGVKLLLDMSQVPFMSSAGLRLLLLLYRQITGQGGKVVLVGVSEDIQDTMSATGFLAFFTLQSTVDAGLETLNQ